MQSRGIPYRRPDSYHDGTMKIFATDQFVLPLPPGHTFPVRKYALLRKRVEEEDLAWPDSLVVPHAATDEELAAVHDPEYIRRVQHGELTPAEVRRLGLPWSPELVERSRRTTGGTIEAGRAALDEGVAVNLAGGTHHAFRDAAEGYCVFNDAAVAVRLLQAEELIRGAVILDCDVHQGNGTAVLFRDDPTVFTFSIHMAGHFPHQKEQSDLDVPLADGTSDAAYLEALDRGLDQALTGTQAELAVYLAGADPYHNDRLGRLALTKVGLAERDRRVLRRCREAGLPVAIAMAGGYARKIEDTVDIHLQTVRCAAGLLS
jgi:acetoin utilization deacetylase AcuC-like enzyme